MLFINNSAHYRVSVSCQRGVIWDGGWKVGMNAQLGQRHINMWYDLKHSLHN